jgi:3'-phosphoadenosine 5'-phosphosulfate sulfotransferase (PAPS reductase)/FAD synthetase
MNIHAFDLIVVNSSAGKDSVCALHEVIRQTDLAGYDRSRIHVSHQDLGMMEWPDTHRFAKKQADRYGLQFHIEKRVNASGQPEDLLEYVLRRGKWPSGKQRWCTSDFKRAPGAKTLRRMANLHSARNVAYVFGFRAAESPARAKKLYMSACSDLCTRTRQVWEWNPILDWSTAMVWGTIKEHELLIHWAYKLGMPRLSCVFCIFAPFDALVLAGIHNPALLDRYVEVERIVGHKFRVDFSIEDVRTAIRNGYKPKNITNWVM